MLPRLNRFGLVIVALVIAGTRLAAEFPSPYNTEKPGLEPMSAAAAAASFKLPPGFKVSVFASEPAVQQPIAMTFDPRGRLWVVENYTYAESKVAYATNLSDRIVIFEDRDNDGHFDQRTVFWDQGKILTSAEVGLGGVFVLSPPNLLFIPDRNGDDVPDGPPQILLDGFANSSGGRHTFANGLKWGPDGWLWGRIGISTGAKIGAPGAVDSQRVEMRGGIWRYHPTRHVFEAVSHGTTNPWGLDWDALGEPFFINTVIGHLWHAIPGAHFQRMHGDDVNPHSYALIGQHADHYHFDVGAGWTKSRASSDGSSFAAGSDNLGGGHAHAGLMIYQGDNWPAPYRDHLFTLNLHGRRVNTERLKRAGSGYVGKHEPDLLSVGDPWFRGLEILQGPDGGVFISDWSDTGECHDDNGVHRTSGRIYKVTYGEPKMPEVRDLTKLTDKELVPMLFDRNEWLARQARRVLVNRQSEGRPMSELRGELNRQFGLKRTIPDRLRAIWALDAVGGADPHWLLGRITTHTKDGNEHIRSWAVRLLGDAVFPLTPALSLRERGSGIQPRSDGARDGNGAASTKSRGDSLDVLTKILPLPGGEGRGEGKARLQTIAIATFITLARQDPSPLVRLYLASALQHLPLDSRKKLALALLAHSEDAVDHNLPLMLWYGIEPLVSAQPDTGVELARASRIPLVRQFIARRLAENWETDGEPLSQLLHFAANAPANEQADVVRGMAEALRGLRRAKAPESWSTFAKVGAASSNPEVRDRTRDLGVLFGDGRALDDLRRIITDPKADTAARRSAIQTLLTSGADGLAALLKQVAAEGALRSAALIGLLQLGDPEASARAVDGYQRLDPNERPALLGALISRPPAAKALLDAVAGGRIPRAELTAFHARQIANLNDAALTHQLTTIWGTLRPTAADKRATIERFRTQLTTDRLQSAALPQGRRLFTQLCAPCHRLFGEGGQVGPDLTGSGRANLDYLLENMVDPSAVVPADYRLAVVTLKDGRVLSGVLRDANDRTLTVQTQTERTTVDRRDVMTLEQSEQSMMPEGLLESLKSDEVRDLIAYLKHSGQVPLPKVEN